MSTGSGKKSVLFVCLGNICRSPIAEAVFKDVIRKRGIEEQWIVDSSAIIGYHTGKGPDRRAMSTLKSHGIKDYQHKARVTTPDDFRKFDFIFGMDQSNMSDLKDIKRQAGGSSTATLQPLGQFDPQMPGAEVPDPYYEDGDAMFHQVLEQCRRCCENFLDKLEEE